MAALASAVDYAAVVPAPGTRRESLPPRPGRPGHRCPAHRGHASAHRIGRLPAFVVERPKDRAHGDFASNAAMLLAKAARTNPRELAQALVAALPPSDDVAKVEIAGPGFINFRLAPGA